MLGFAPAHQDAAAAAPAVYGTPVAGALLASLGMLAFGLLALMPTTFGDTSVLRTLIALSLAAGGAFGVVIGYVSVSTRIEVGPNGLVIAAPGWRACPYPPVEEVRLQWHEVRAIHHRTEIYRIGFLPLRLPVEVYAIQTSRDWIVFGSYYLWDLEPVLIDIAHRAGCSWREQGDIETGLLQTLRHGAPPWPKAIV
jgi:hypothetical protein